jgi:hypothetical protein
VKPRFRTGEVVRLPDGAPRQGEAVVDDVAGPDDDGNGWLVQVWVDEPGGTRSLWTFAENALEATGELVDARGRRVDAARVAPADERFDVLRIRLVTELTDGVQAARLAERFDNEIRALVGPSVITVEAERHWAEPYHYELEVTARPLGDAVAALRCIAEAGGDGWLSCADDGWRCDLWWGGDDDGFDLAVVVGAEVSFLPWSSPARRPAGEQPLVNV